MSDGVLLGGGPVRRTEGLDGGGGGGGGGVVATLAVAAAAALLSALLALEAAFGGQDERLYLLVKGNLGEGAVNIPAALQFELLQ